MFYFKLWTFTELSNHCLEWISLHKLMASCFPCSRFRFSIKEVLIHPIVRPKQYSCDVRNWFTTSLGGLPLRNDTTCACTAFSFSGGRLSKSWYKERTHEPNHSMTTGIGNATNDNAVVSVSCLDVALALYSLMS